MLRLERKALAVPAGRGISSTIVLLSLKQVPAAAALVESRLEDRSQSVTNTIVWCCLILVVVPCCVQIAWIVS